MTKTPWTPFLMRWSRNHFKRGISRSSLSFMGVATGGMMPWMRMQVSKIRNSKSETNSNVKASKFQTNRVGSAFWSLDFSDFGLENFGLAGKCVLVIGISGFGFVSNFGLRISDLRAADPRGHFTAVTGPQSIDWVGNPRR